MASSGSGPSIEIPSFCKVNWFLRVEGRREDGYHQITTLFQSIDLSDRLTFQATDEPAIELETSGYPVARGAENLVFRAAAALRERIGGSAGLRISLWKGVPAGSGLGGGSSNAAMTLLAANQLWKGGLGIRELSELASLLGADVPFFLTGGSALGTGRGEQLAPLPDSGLEAALILIYPGFPVSTREAYAAGNWGRYRGRALLTSLDLEHKIQHFREAMERGLEDLSWLGNDFENLILERYPALKEACDHLTAAGCERVLLCGSGSTLMGIAEAARGEEVFQEVSRRATGDVFLCRSLSRTEYRRIYAQAGLELQG